MYMYIHTNCMVIVYTVTGLFSGRVDSVDVGIFPQNQQPTFTLHYPLMHVWMCTLLASKYTLSCTITENEARRGEARHGVFTVQ